MSAEDEGMLKVICWPAPVMVKSLPVVEVAKVTAPLEVVAKPVPRAVKVPALWVMQVPLYWRQPEVRLRPFEKVEVAEPVIESVFA